MRLTEILEYARLAPSAHNTQPWHFKVNDNDSTLSLFLAPDRALDAGDPTKRETWVSLGACFETILQAADGLGCNTKILLLQTDDLSSEIARLQFTERGGTQSNILNLLKNRYSHRAAMRSTPVPTSLIESCQQVISDIPGISVRFTDNKQTIARIADFTDKGIRLALSSAKFRQELAPLLHSNWSRARTGLHGFVLNHGIVGSLWEKWSVIFGIDSKRTARADRQKILEASGLLFITSKGDVPKFWFNSGRAYMRIVLEITRADFAHSTMTAPVEAGRFHEDIEHMLSTTDRIQSMIRIGKAAHPVKHRSPRLSIDELLT